MSKQTVLDDLYHLENGYSEDYWISYENDVLKGTVRFIEHDLWAATRIESVDERRGKDKITWKRLVLGVQTSVNIGTPTSH